MKNMSLNTKRRITLVGSIISILLVMLCTIEQHKLYRTGYYSLNKTEMIYETVTNQLLVDARDIANYHLFDIDSLHVNSRFSVDNSNLRYKFVTENGDLIAKNSLSWVTSSELNYEIYIQETAYAKLELFKEPSSVVNYALGDKYIFHAYIDPDLQVDDAYSQIIGNINRGYKALNIIHPASIIFSIFAVIFLYLFARFHKSVEESEEGIQKINYARLKNIVIKVYTKLLQYLRKLSVIKRTVLFISFACVLELIILRSCHGDVAIMTLLWVFVRIIILAYLFSILLDIKKMKQGAEEIAAGNLEYKIEADTMNSGLKKYADYLNNIGEALNVALEKRIQSERMKTELITNVSHDIKTPITSIINYAVLIEKESCDSPKHKEYAEVLVRKATHLKRLLDDLVEASKASTGAIEMKLEDCEANVLLTQVVGEFEQRLEDSKLQLVTNAPEEAILIHVDSKRIWRVFENLMTNACKYSLEGSRVYLNLDKVGNEAIFSFRNTSKAMLNVSADELMERFVRGDSSRSTEGNGLGLSIAKSLTELQNGKMDIIIDGDLFKVILKFPIIS